MDTVEDIGDGVEKLLGRILLISRQGSWRTHLNFPSNNAVPGVPPPYPVLMLHVMAAIKPTVNRLLSRQEETQDHLGPN